MDQHSHQHLHDMMRVKREAAPDVTTQDGVVLSVVYVTAEPTFTGVIGGYTTLSDDSTAAEQTQDVDTAAATPDSQNTSAAAAPQDTSVVQTINFADSSFSSAGGANTFASAAGSTFVTATAASITSNSHNTNTAVAGAATASSSTPSSSSSSSDGGMSTGGKAGLAIGIIAIIGIFAALLLWFLGKKKREQEAYNKADDEKTTFGAAAAAVPMTNTNHHNNYNQQQTDKNTSMTLAPRLSLRPVSRMMPEFMGSSSKSRLSNGNMLNTPGESGAMRNGRTPSPQPRAISPLHEEKPNPNNPFNDPQNPFADPERPVAPPVTRKAAPVPAPFVPAPLSTSNTGSAVAGVIAGAAVGAARSPNPYNAGPVREQPRERPQEQPREQQRELPREQLREQPGEMARDAVPSPGPGPMPMAAGASSGPDSSQGNVYRVLMDFKPSMDDELELLTGQLVRCLHEYDDGWALCIRLDRSQQGVVPRTCLAAKPSKPKPSHLNQYARGPGGPGGNGRMSPAMGRPMSPAGGRPMSPAGRPMSPAGRPMSPAGRPMSPAGGPGGRMNVGPHSNGPRNGPNNGSPRGQMPPQGRAMSPGAFNQAPRPLSPGPRPQQRSQSPGPYGASGRKPMAPPNTRRRSNSASNVRDRRNSPPGPSKLGPGSPMYRSQSPGIAL